MKNALAPMAWTLFSQNPVPPSKNEWLYIVNDMVNKGIVPEHSTPPDMDKYTIWPTKGWCHDYAVTKRYELMLRGFTAAECLLCECYAPDGETHMVLLVNGYALDNLRNDIVKMEYQIIRQQSPENPDFWLEPDA